MNQFKLPGHATARKSTGSQGPIAQFQLHPNFETLPSLFAPKWFGRRNAFTLAKTETALAELVDGYRGTVPKLADWLEQNVPRGLAVFTLPEDHRRRLRTSNPFEHSIQQELKRRTVKDRVFPSDEALLRLATAILVGIDENGPQKLRPTSSGDARMGDLTPNEFPDSRLHNRGTVQGVPPSETERCA